jgi:hypothetical protein
MVCGAAAPLSRALPEHSSKMELDYGAVAAFEISVIDL